MQQKSAGIVTRFKAQGWASAAAMLAVLVAVVLVAIWVSLDAPQMAATTSVVAADQGDMALYAGIVEQMRGGDGYYVAAHEQLLGSGYGTQSVFNWRLPTLFWFIALFPSIGLAQIVVMVLAVGTGVAAGCLLHRQGGWVLAGPGALWLMLSLTGAFTPDAILLSELPAGLLILLSASLYGLGQRRWGMGFAVLALLLRELSGIYVLVCIYLAWREKRRGELLAWGAVLAGYGLYFIWHYAQVQAQILPTDPAYPDGWVQFGGLGFILATSAFNGYFALLPAWCHAVLLPLALLGILAMPGDGHARLMVGAAIVVFAVIGKPFNAYWGALYTPLLAIGLAYAPFAVRDLCHAIWQGRLAEREKRP